MLKKLTTVTAATLLALTIGVAHAAPETNTGPVELSATDMDNVNAGGWHKQNRPRKFHRTRGSRADASAVATAVGSGARASTRTETYVENGFADSASTSHASIRGGKKFRRGCGC